MITTGPFRSFLIALILAGVFPWASAAEPCWVDPEGDHEWTVEGSAMELRAVLEHGVTSLAALLDLWNSPNPAAGTANLARQYPDLGARLAALDTCIETNLPALEELRRSDLPPLIVRLLERHVRTEVLLRYVFSHLPEEIPQMIRETFPPDQDFEYLEIVPLGLEYLAGSAAAIDAFLFEVVLPHINPDDALHHALFQAGYQRLSQAAKQELREGTAPRVAFARGSGVRRLIAAQVDAGHSPEAVRAQARLQDLAFQASLRELLEVLGRGVDDPTGLALKAPKLRQWLWALWCDVSAERAGTETILKKLRERSRVEREEWRTLSELRLHSVHKPYSYPFFAKVVAMVAGDAADTFRYDLIERWALDDRYFLGFAARLSGPPGLTARDLDLLPSVDIEESSSLHAVILNAADASARSEEGLDENLARLLGEYLLNLSKTEWAAMQAHELELRQGLPNSLVYRRGSRIGLYGSLVTTRFLADHGAVRQRLMSDHKYAAFLTEYLGLEEGAPLAF